ncbi:MAG TPA: hypothetical protein PKX76_04335, partial [Flexilinea sp.]|nr:hypothetical protein [Flexilinea sp.]
AQLAPEQRAQLEAQMQMMLGNENKTPLNYVKTGKKSTWCDSECEIYDGMKKNKIKPTLLKISKIK